jgi:site-specific DNA-methyltransferase (adenine-specific)
MEINLNELSNIKGIGKKTIQRVREYKLKKKGYISKYNPDLKLDLNSINNGDCLELMNGIPDKSIDMILADLPYGTTACSWDSVINLDKLWLQYERVIKDNGAIVLTAKQPFTTELINSNKNLFRYTWVWDKVISPNFMNAKKMHLNGFEEILVFYKELPTYNPQMEEGKPFIDKRSGKGRLKHNMYGDKPNYKEQINTGERYPRGIIKFSARNNNPIHPTQKPIALFEYLIKTYTNKGDTILDNVSGSGTTAIASINTDRNYICIEKEKKYYDLSIKRVEGVKVNG